MKNEAIDLDTKHFHTDSGPHLGSKSILVYKIQIIHNINYACTIINYYLNTLITFHTHLRNIFVAT